MKPGLFSLLFTLCIGQLLSAQSAAPSTAKPTDPEIRKTTEALVAKYSLNADQAKQMYRIQERKHRNMTEIAALQSSDAALYQVKYGNVQKGTWASIRRILNTKEQVVMYQKTQSDLRVQRNAVRKKLTAEKASKEAIETAVLAIYAE